MPRFTRSMYTFVFSYFMIMSAETSAQVASALRDGNSKPAEVKPIELVVAPAATPIPPLRYRLLPLSSKLVPGDAAPIYLRLWAGMKGDAIHELEEKPSEFINKPIDQFNVAEARKFIDRWRIKLEQIHFATHRRTCDWNYTIPEQSERVVEILLPDAQDMRSWSRLIALKERVEIAEHRYDDAIQTIQDGLALSRHVATTPFLINQMVGAAIAQETLARVEELIARPDAPDLYWALAVLPSPLIDYREALENEEILIERMIPEIKEATRPHTDLEWASLSARIHARIVELEKMSESFAMMQRDQTVSARTVAGALDRASIAMAMASPKGLKGALLKPARESAKRLRGLTDEAIAQLSEDQLVVWYIYEQYRLIWDDAFKGSFLPYADSIEVDRAARERLKPVQASPLRSLAAMIPAIDAARRAGVRLDAKIALLRTVEAIRLHAALNGGSPPDTLEQIKIVPIPLNPITSKLFEYRRDGDAAIVEAEKPLMKGPVLGYRITIRK